MIRIGEYNNLVVYREMPQGLYLTEKDGDEEILLPRNFVTDDMVIDSAVRVFVYCDSEGREMATTEIPILTVGQYAFLKVNMVNDIGAFCSWGTSKELLVPYRNQARPLEEGESYVVHMYLDEVSDRLVGTTKLRKFLTHIADDNIRMGQEVQLLIYGAIDIGYKVIVDNRYAGLLYKNESHLNLKMGQIVKGYVKPIREDGKIDLSLTPIGYKSIFGNEKLIMDMLEKAGGYLPFSDKSDPDQIRRKFGLSKKLFKKVIGSLYKKKLISLDVDGINQT